jgi:hypothetical protein
LPTLAKMATAMLRNEQRQEVVPDHNSRWFRFGLRDLLMVMVPVGIAAWIISQFAGVGLLIAWPDVFYASLLLAVIGLVAYGVLASRWRWLFAILLAIAVFQAAAIDTFGLGDWLGTGESIGIQKSLANFGIVSRQAVLAQILCLYSLAALCVVAGLSILAVASSKQRRTIWRILTVGTLLPPVIFLAWIYWQMVGVAEIPVNPSLPENVYPQILELAKRLEQASPKEVDVIHGEVLDLLDHPGCVQLDWYRTSSDPASANDISALAQYRNLSRSLQAKAESLHIAAKHDDAARYELAILKLGTTHLRGGLVLHALTGIAVDGVGTALLARHRAEYSPPLVQKIISEVAVLERSREAPAVIMARDRAFENVAWRWRPRLGWAINRLFFGESFEGLAAPQNNFLRHAYQRQQTDEQLLLADLAIRLYHRDYCRWPASLDDLAPDYLRTVPTDPHVGAPLIYRPSDDGFILYSVGQDGRDNGGKVGTRLDSMKPGFDLDLDTITR